MLQVAFGLQVFVSLVIQNCCLLVEFFADNCMPLGHLGWESGPVPINKIDTQTYKQDNYVSPRGGKGKDILGKKITTFTYFLAFSEAVASKYIESNIFLSAVESF